MGYFSKQIKNYLLSASPDQLEADRKLLEKYAGAGPLINDYFNNLECRFVIKVASEKTSLEFDSLDFSLCA